MAITKRAIDALSYNPAGTPAQILWDGSLPGFGVRVFPSGAKSFIVDYRVNGRKRRITIGRYGVLTPHQGREKALQTLSDVTKGADPAEERQRKHAAGTLRDFTATYLERHAKTRKKTWREDQRRLAKYVLPDFGSRKLESVTRADVTRLHDKIGEHAQTEANRVIALLSVVFTKAEEWGYLPEGAANPTRRVKPFKEQSRDRWVKPSELPLLWAAIQAEENPYARAFFVLALLLGCRRSELLNARWENVDLNRREIRLPNTKAGNTHTVPLSQEATAIFTELPRMLGSPHVFPSPVDAGEPMRDVKRQWKRIRTSATIKLWTTANPVRASELRASITAAGIAESDMAHDRLQALVLAEIRKSGENPFDVRLHDLRRTVGSWLATGGASLHLIGTVLNHAEADTTRIYARLAEDATRNALDEHAAAIYKVAGHTL